MINKNNNECETQACNYPKIRTRFYNGMLLTDQHLRDEQEYHREKLRSVNRNLFGAGIVCGLKVTAPKVGLCIKIDPGVALDCCGNLIEVCKCINLDLSKLCKEKYGQSCIATDDSTRPVIRKNLVLSYKEIESDPEPVLTPAADCRSAGDKSNCQQSKVKEGYCIELWDEDKCPCMETQRGGVKPIGEIKPEGDVPTMPNVPVDAPRAQTEKAMMETRTAIKQKTWEDLLEAFLKDNPLPCYPCGCCKNSVGLATLEIDCVANTVKVEKTCRTYVISPRLIRWIVSSIQTKEGARRSLLDYMPALGGEAEPGGGETPKETTPVDTTDKSTKKSAAASKKAADKSAETESQSPPPDDSKK